MPPLLLLLFASFLQLPAPASSANSKPSCSRNTCGNLTISYPFWLEEPGRPACGSPSFQLKCNASRAYLAHSVLAAYRVVDIFVENNSFVAVDENLPLTTGCPAPPFNISDGIGLGPFSIRKANANLLFLSCNHPLPVVPAGFRSLSCGDNSFIRLGGDGNLQVQGGTPPGCNFTVVPVRERPNGSKDGYVASMRNGFLLEWTVTSGDCPKCFASGGECAYADDGLGFACNCSGVMHAEKCDFRYISQ